MRLFSNYKDLRNGSNLWRNELQKTPRFSIFDKCLDYITIKYHFDFNALDSTAATLYWIPYSVFALILLTLLIPVLSTFLNNIMARCHTLPDRRAIFFTLFEDRIRREFRTQSVETMSTIVAAVSHILRATPERPSILLCLGSSEGKYTIERICRATASAVMSSFQKPSHDVDKATLDCSKYKFAKDMPVIFIPSYASSDDFWTFYEDVTERMYRYKVVILTEFEKINAQVATAFSHLADDTYAPFPQSIIIVCLDTGSRFSPNHLKRQAPVNLAETFLEEKWESLLDPVSIAEIFARLTGRAVLIEREIPLGYRSTGSLPSIKGCSGRISPKLRRRRQIARS